VLVEQIESFVDAPEREHAVRHHVVHDVALRMASGEARKLSAATGAVPFECKWRVDPSTLVAGSRMRNVDATRV
jgi:hypothetical protein